MDETPEQEQDRANREFFAAFDRLHADIDMLKRMADQDREHPRNRWHMNMLSGTAAELMKANDRISKFFEQD